MLKKITAILISFVLFLSISLYAQNRPIIIDHNCTDLTKVPDNFVIKAKNDYRLSYGHTSHGSQIVTGMNLLNNKEGSIYTYNKSTGSLYLRDAYPSGDLGNPDRTTWAQRTRDLLNNNTINANMIMWSWCGQASSASEDDINSYLNLMDQLEKDFPAITFVYMTGHLDGSGETGNLNQRNEQIRDFCRNNNKILFDFADIESYDPDGNYFLNKRANDACAYYDGSTQKNWAEEWCAANPGKCEDCGSCAHSHCLNCQQKGKAFWWMLARIAGWDGQTGDVEGINNNDKPIDINVSPNPFSEIINIQVSLNRLNSENIEIRVYNSTGIQVAQLLTGKRESGKYTLEFDGTNFSSGVYYLIIHSGVDIQAKPIMLLK